jgi:hypothetical protein
VHPRGRNPASARTRARPRGHERVCADAMSARTQPSIRTDVSVRPRGHWAASARTQKNKKFGSFCRFGKREFFFNFQFSVFGFQSPKSPKSPNSPNSPNSTGEATRRRRFFRPSSPSHPSKLYSSLGWLNSKVLKPIPPFSLRLIDVDGF